MLPAVSVIDDSKDQQREADKDDQAGDRDLSGREALALSDGLSWLFFVELGDQGLQFFPQLV